MLNIEIRHEQLDDIQSIHDVTVAAFLDAPHTDHREQYIARELRKSNALTLSIVAENEGEIVGHVAVPHVVISDGSDNWYGLGPISVLPKCQGKGVGKKLITTALEALKIIGAQGCVVLGDPNYYHRFGFSSKEGLILPDVPAEYFQALVIHGDLPVGKVSYHGAFLAKD
ncbi:GNAT family N-acetyltransferase [Pleionea litopenaei]|uniref:N-acetyltransferase n=1 Tax=Pleionea litopenaei TaxID=3070815 RepID=A0AA51RWQ2_9GAMM|nr:N-acetyltransferase [Pleionea sp. HL-JVS1]WMS88997.1 N-acetyltransferase [Pleionea sp. HL-JVS1]